MQTRDKKRRNTATSVTGSEGPIAVDKSTLFLRAMHILGVFDETDAKPQPQQESERKAT